MKHVNPVPEPERGGSDVAVCQETLGKMSKLSIIPTCHTKEFVVEAGCLPLESAVHETPRLTPADLQKPISQRDSDSDSGQLCA